MRVRKLPAVLILLVVLAVFVAAIALSSCGTITFTETVATTTTASKTTIVTSTIAKTATVTTTATKTIEVNAAKSTTEPAYFMVSDIDIQPITIDPGTEFTVSVLVTNLGGSRGTYDTVLVIEGMGEFFKTVILDPGESKLVIFSLTDAPEEGIYGLKIGGISTDLYTG